MEKKKIILSVVMLLLLVVVTIGVTYAAFTFSKEGTVENTIESSTVMLTYTEGKTGIILEDALPISDETGKLLTGDNNIFEFTVTATLGKSSLIGYEVTAVKIPIMDMEPLLDNEVKLYLERAIDPDTTYEEILMPTNFIPRENQTQLGSPVGSMILDSGTFINEGTTIHNYRLRLWIDENANIPNGESRKYGVKINVYAKQDVMGEPVEQPIQGTSNTNIRKIFTYNQTSGASNFCVTGEENTCVSLRKAPETYPTGTILKYKVNDTEEKYFHVVSDNGNTLTLQQRENTVYDTAWYADTAANTKGPLTILSALERATVGWTNVLNQVYTMGTTVFKDNAFTGCSSYNSCTTNTYTLGERTAKARMITVQEAQGLGCTSSNSSCPIWMCNYLNSSTSYGGTVNQTGDVYGKNWGYWTMNAVSSGSSRAWRVHSYRFLYKETEATSIGNGGRAVVVIEK